MTKKHEWKSVSFIRHSCSLHYSRFMLSSLKEGQALISAASIFFAGLPVGLASIGSGIGPGTPLDIFGAVFLVFLIGLITLFIYYSNKYKDKEKTLSKALTIKSKQSQEPKAKFEEEETSQDFTDSEDDESFREEVFRYMQNFFGDLVFERILAEIVHQVDGRTYQARFCETKLIVTCYLRPELYSNLNRPLVRGLVRLEYNYVSLVYDIIELTDSKLTDSKKKEGPPWAWNTVFAEIIGEYEDEDEDESIFYASLEPGQVVLCKVFDHLRNTLIQYGDTVYLEVNETDRSFYKIIEIVERSL